MSLSYNKSGFKKEHAIIAVLFAALLAVVAYIFFMQGAGQKQPALESQPVASPVAQEASNQPMPTTNADTQINGIELAVGKYEGEVHPIVDILDDLQGFKYDESVPAADTVYIIYDPRCPYCHALFNKIQTIDLKAKQITIKWLPTLALGEDSEAAKRAVASLTAKSVEEFGASFQSETDFSGITLSQSDQDALNENMAFLFEASDQTFGVNHPKSVPATFFINKKTGAPNMMYGASDDAVFKQIFGE